MSEEPTSNTKKKNRKKKNNTKICFDEEILTKDKADILKNKFEQTIEVKNVKKKPKRQKIKKNLTASNTSEVSSAEHLVNNAVNKEAVITDASTTNKKKRKKKKNNEGKLVNEHEDEPATKKQKDIEKSDSETQETDDEEKEIQEELNPSNPEIKKTESIRALKRKKHTNLLQEKKLKSELKMQEKCLNYLSQWKYNRAGWKFEKLLQVWLQQHMFDDARIPEKFWDTLVEYFNNAKGKSRQDILKDAVKLIESHEKPEEEVEDNEKVKYERAQTIVQMLQE